jgi:hypothetical protein
MLSRRQFLLLVPGMLLFSGGVAYAGYRTGKCPLSAENICVGPCAALRDGDGDLWCDRFTLAPAAQAAVNEAAPLVPAVAPTTAPTAAPTAVPPTVAAAVQPATPTPAKPTATPLAITKSTPVPLNPSRVTVACPKGLVNDRYPGRCRLYVDRNGNGICDLSEPQGT